MDAIVLAPEPAASLWPIPAGGSYAGIPVLDRSLLAWIARRLERAGVTRLLLALGPDAQAPEDVPIPLTVRRVPEGTGTAAALAAFREELSGGDLLVIWRGALWDFDLEKAVARHGRQDRPVTRLLNLDGGAPGGPKRRVIPFPERGAGPGGADTGMAVFSPSAFRRLSGAEDLERDLFPRLERAGLLRTAHTVGYLQPIDDPAALLRACADLLSGKCRGDWDGPPERVGVWTRTPIPEDVELIPPCRIGAGVSLGKGCLIGPHVYLSDGACVGDHSLVQRSVVGERVVIGSRSTVYGAVVCPSAELGHYTVLNEGAVVGPGARIGDNAILMEGVGVAPGVSVPPSLRLTERFSDSAAPEPPAPRPGPVVEDMVRLGRRLGRCGTVGTGGSGFRGLLLARAVGCGAAAQGAAVIFHDGTRPEQAAWLARYYGWPASAFVDEDGRVYLFDREGEALSRPPADGEGDGGSWDQLAGTAAAYAAAMEREQDMPQACSAFRDWRRLELL